MTGRYDLSPQPRSGGQSAQAMAISRDGVRESRLSVCLDAADEFGIRRDQTRGIVQDQVTVIDQDWDEVARAARLSRAESHLMRHGPGAQILNPFIHGAG